MSQTETIHETSTASDPDRARGDRKYEQELRCELRRNTKPQCPPSVQIQAQLAFERAFYADRGRHPEDRLMGYNIVNEASTLTQIAVGWLTNDVKRYLSGYTKAETPRHALAYVAWAIGYRYVRGLAAVECRLEPSQLVEFRFERNAFMQQFYLAADAAHAINGKGQHPEAALEAINLFVQELQALCPWFEITGHQSEGAALYRKMQG